MKCVEVFAVLLMAQQLLLEETMSEEETEHPITSNRNLFLTSACFWRFWRICPSSYFSNTAHIQGSHSTFQGTVPKSKMYLYHHI